MGERCHSGARMYNGMSREGGGGFTVNLHVLSRHTLAAKRASEAVSVMM